MAYEAILCSVRDGVAVITLNRPDKLNAWNGAMHRDVKAAMRAAADDAAVRVIVLTGAGRGFCAGADMNTLQGIQDGTQSTGAAEKPFDPNANPNFQKTYSYFPSVPKPIIAAVNGACAGLGFVLALYADIRLASDAAVFTTSFSKRGLIAEHGVSWLLPRLVGIARAADLLFTSRKVSGHEAAQMGLVNQVIDFDRFEVEVMDYARLLADEVSPRSLREMKREIWGAQFETLGEAIETANHDMPGSFVSEDFKEGVAHFLEKRAPSFTGR